MGNILSILWEIEGVAAVTVFDRWWTSLNVLDFEWSNEVCKKNDFFFSAVTPWYAPEPGVELTSPVVWEEQLASFVP